MLQKQNKTSLENLKNRKPFKKGDPRINRSGRMVSNKGKPKRMRAFLKELKKTIGKDEVITYKDLEQFLTIYVNLTEGELKKIENDKALPMVTRSTATYVLHHGYEFVESLIDKMQTTKFVENMPKTKFVIVTDQTDESIKERNEKERKEKEEEEAREIVDVKVNE